MLLLLSESFNPFSLLMLTAAGLINAFGVVLFLSPVSLYDSGVSGTSKLLSQLTGGSISLSVFLLLLNIPLFLYGLRRQGVTFTMRSLYAVAVYSLSAACFARFATGSVSPISGSDLLLCAVFGGLIPGIGSGITIMDAHGFFSNEKKSIVYFVVNRFQIAKLRTVVHSIDDHAFISITEVSNLFGKNAK